MLLTTYVVTSTSDSAQAGSGSLRAAIMAANAHPGADVIKFNIVTTPGQTTPPEILVGSPLPALTGAVTSDGTSEPKWGMVQIDGANAGQFATGLTLMADGCHIEGLDLTHWSDGIDVQSKNNQIDHNLIGLDTKGNAGGGQSGVYIQGTTGNQVHDNVLSGWVSGVYLGSGAKGNTLQNNRIGTDATGETAVANQFGVVLTGGSSDNKVLDNEISGNTEAGVYLNENGTGNLIQDNIIGADAKAVNALGNGEGVLITTGAYANTIQGNVIGGNTGNGVVLEGASGNQLIGNFIGVDKTFLHKLANQLQGVLISNVSADNTLKNNVIFFSAQEGVWIEDAGSNHNHLTNNSIAYSGLDGVLVSDGASYNFIGAPQAGNTIYANGVAGVAIGDDFGPSGSIDDTTVGNSVLSNSIYLNAGLGIDLGSDGPTPNTVNPADGPNHLQNHPVLNSALSFKGGVTIGGSLQTAPGSYRLEFFAAINGQGMIYLGSLDVSTDPNGKATFSTTLSNAMTKQFATPGQQIVATATDKTFYNTSEFSTPVTIAPFLKVPPLPPVTRSDSRSPGDLESSGRWLALVWCGRHNVGVPRDRENQDVKPHPSQDEPADSNPNPEGSSAAEEEMAALLAAFDESLRAGTLVGPGAVPPELQRAEACLRVLESVWPRTPQPPPRGELTLGQKVGQYELLEHIGRGGMGTVYRARDTQLGRLVALKFLAPERAGDPHFLHRFQREARTASGLNHPGIATVHAFGWHDRQPYIVMEWIDGQSFRALIGQPLEVAVVTRLVRQAAKALAAAHAAGIVHRDVKPENLMVRSDGYVKVLDFGLARALPTLPAPDPARDFNTKPGVLLGTTSYMSPEQARGEPVDSSTDVFSLGIVLYELATGQHPFDRGQPIDVLCAIVRQTLLPPQSINPDLPAPLAKLIERMLTRDRAARPRADEVVALLGPMSDLPGHVGPPAEWSVTKAAPLAGPSRKRLARRIWLAFAGAVVILAGLGAVALAPWRRPSENAAAPEPARWPDLLEASGSVQALAVSPDPSRPLLAWVSASGRDISEIGLWDGRTGERLPGGKRNGNLMALALSPDGRRLAFGGDGWNVVEVVNIDLSESRSLRLRNGALRTLAFSPDGNELVAAVELNDTKGGMTLTRFDLGSGRAIEPSPAVAHLGKVSSIKGMAWGRGAGAVALSRADGWVILWDTSSWKAPRTLKAASGHVYGLAFSPDGRYLAGAIAGVKRDEMAMVRVWDLQTGQEARPLKGGKGELFGVDFAPDGRTIAASGIGHVSVWDVSTGKLRDTFEAPRDGLIRTLRFAPDGTTIFTGSYARTIRRWTVTPAVR
jgi:parallel beta-helix repeat protein